VQARQRLSKSRNLARWIELWRTRRHVERRKSLNEIRHHLAQRRLQQRQAPCRKSFKTSWITISTASGISEPLERRAHQARIPGGVQSEARVAEVRRIAADSQADGGVRGDIQCTSNQSIDLFEKTLGVYQTTSAADAQRRVHDVLESSLNALEVNVHTAQMRGRMLKVLAETWDEYMRTPQLAGERDN
jgi:hypothetical protein